MQINLLVVVLKMKMLHKELVEELLKPTIRKFEKIKVQLSFIDNIWGIDFADMQLFSKFNKGFVFLLFINIFSKYAWVISLKDKKGTTITNALQKILDESNRKPNEMWIDRDSEFYNISMKSFLHKNIMERYSTHNEGKSVVGERFIKTLKNKIYKYMIPLSKNVYIDKLDDIVNKYNNTYQRTIEMKLADVKSNTYINSSKEINDKDPKCKIGDIIRISKYKKHFCKRLRSKLV